MIIGGYVPSPPLSLTFPTPLPCLTPLCPLVCAYSAEVLILTVVLLYNFLGLAALGGLCVIVVTAPLNSALHKAMKRRQATLMKR